MLLKLVRKLPFTVIVNITNDITVTQDNSYDKTEQR